VLLATVCWCSNVKKLFNGISQASRTLRIGRYQMSMSQLYVLYEGTDPSSTGIWRTDVDEQRNKQNVPPVLRMVSEVGSSLAPWLCFVLPQRWWQCAAAATCVRVQRARNALQSSADFAVQFKGLHAYLEVISDYHDAFASRDLSMLDRLARVSHAVFFLRFWNVWLDASPAFNRASNGISNQAVTDLEINAGALFTMAAWLCQDCDAVAAVKPLLDPQRMVGLRFCCFAVDTLRSRSVTRLVVRQCVGCAIFTGHGRR
jgi:hypothetical protein